ncbi:YbjN domain-containing protein [Celeribacter halophilus]|uniref:YbjN domain-containing protein n=1 Tax=Celeribacter halophilus TaxID=576117 RepID=A0AAW7XN38_9RHOB|nr:YbjN domain-containing protein [Celeribacter halophilus]MDO6455668.1 YbjN domain-containing protein [Celeribacter halophilus]MDO6721858.1 YbjN domain-containing protein [Celeribacter halophilus]
MFRSALLASTVLCASTLGATAAPEVLTFDDLETFENLLSGYGSVELETDSEGDPMFRGRIGGVRYGLYFYGCEDHKDCNNGTFVAYFDGDDYVTDASVINAYNNGFRFGKASVDSDGDLEINYSFAFKGGITREALDDTFDWWRVVLEQSEEFFE